jgi:hypothetical protein
MVRRRYWPSSVAAAALSLWAGACAHPRAAGGPPAAAPAASSDSSDRSAIVTAPNPKDKPSGDHPWGAPVADAAAEKAVSEALAAVGDGQADVGRFGEPLVVGPALWKILVGLDAGLANAGTFSLALIPHPGRDPEKLEMRTFLEAAEVGVLTRSPAFRKIGRAFATANIRPADDGERQLFYAFVPFELAGQPVTIAERGRDRLLVYLDEHHRPTWIDVLSAYGASNPPAK